MFPPFLFDAVPELATLPGLAIQIFAALSAAALRWTLEAQKAKTWPRRLLFIDLATAFVVAGATVTWTSYDGTARIEILSAGLAGFYAREFAIVGLALSVLFRRDPLGSLTRILQHLRALPPLPPGDDNPP